MLLVQEHLDDDSKMHGTHSIQQAAVWLEPFC